MATKKYFCPHHEESTPSAVAYSNGYYSFCCGKSGPLSDLGLAPGERIEVTYVEDLAASIASIKRLPKQKIRGFELHADDSGYFLIWPDDAYYKRRIYGAGSGNKYRGPSGHPKPWFKTRLGGSERLVLIEGEFNALTYQMLETGYDVISPGGAGDFYSKTAKDEIFKLGVYSQVDIAVDEDAAGVQAAIESKALLYTRGYEIVNIHLMKKDFNDLYVENGKEAIKEEARKMGLL